MTYMEEQNNNQKAPTGAFYIEKNYKKVYIYYSRGISKRIERNGFYGRTKK